MDKQRLNKYIATNFGVSRREADILIQKGAVRINGKVVDVESGVLRVHVAVAVDGGCPRGEFGGDQSCRRQAVGETCLEEHVAEIERRFMPCVVLQGIWF